MDDSTEIRPTGLREKENIIEPTTREDGVEFSAWKNTYNDGSSFFIIKFGPMESHYSTEEVELLGDGDWDRGCLKISQAYYNSPTKELFRTGKKLFHEDLKQLHDQH